MLQAVIVEDTAELVIVDWPDVLDPVVELDVAVGKADLLEAFELEVAEVVALAVMVPPPVALPSTPLASILARRDEK